jgi:hypothetical protein
MSSVEGPEEPAQASEPPASEAASVPKKKKKKKARPAPPPPKTEAEINSPTNQTIGMLSVIGVLTFFMWIFARGGCNYHPPKETRNPRKVDLIELAREPKDAAMEFELRFDTKAFSGALELAKGALVDTVKRAQTACDADVHCAQRASDLRAQCNVSAELLERGPTTAVVRVLTDGLGGKPEKHLLHVEREQTMWKVTERDADDPNFKARPTQLIGHEHDGGMLLRQPGMPEPAMSPNPAASAGK